MDIDECNQFKLNGQKVCPARQGRRAGYVIQGREWDLLDWQDLKAVTGFNRAVEAGIIEPSTLDDSKLYRSILLQWLQSSL
ncbi:MAG: hypothetical protein GYB33_04895 [Gammaproteobacteria bacterium]|nr:hypothetical protein [Gammaproteobacteria bacterium]